MIVASFWTGSPLSFFEQVCLKSFAAHGHKTVLYSYTQGLNVPSGVELADATDILPEPADYGYSGGFAQFADIFRINLIQKTGATWVDCDVACLQPMPDRPYLFAMAGRWTGNAVLRLPQDSPALGYLVDLFNAKDLVLPPDWPWRHLLPQDILDRAQPTGFHISEIERTALPYMTFGPVALHYALEKTGEGTHRMPPHSFYPVHPIVLRRNYFRPKLAPIIIPEDTIAIHHVGGKPFQVKFASLGEFVPPHPNSFIGKLCTKYDIDPAAAPVQIKSSDEPEAVSDAEP